MKVFLDTDVILDFLGKREPFAQHASLIFAAGYHKQINLFTSSNSITACYYVLSQYSSSKKARQLILELLKEISVIPVTEGFSGMDLNLTFQMPRTVCSILPRFQSNRWLASLHEI